jgi:hypothetical protein
LRLHFVRGLADGLYSARLVRGLGRLSAQRVSRQRWLRLHQLHLACPQLQFMCAELRVACAKLRITCAELRFACLKLLPALLRSSVALHHSEHRKEDWLRPRLPGSPRTYLLQLRLREHGLHERLPVMHQPCHHGEPIPG